jgi:XTP/dITP diphosphohydrolase
MMEIYFATQNPNKLEEIQARLPRKWTVKGLDQLKIEEAIPETHDTIEGNSWQKARYIFDRFQVACFADDTGLEVEALAGAPGVYSAMYAGPERNSEANMDLLLKQLENQTNRKAAFKTVITYIEKDGTEHQFTGTVDGVITREKCGQKGFGYDPVFQPAGYDITFAEMSLEEKNTISHRSRAVDQLIEFLKQHPAR